MTSGYEKIIKTMKRGGILYANGTITTTFMGDRYEQIVEICNEEIEKQKSNKKPESLETPLMSKQTVELSKDNIEELKIHNKIFKDGVTILYLPHLHPDD